MGVPTKHGNDLLMPADDLERLAIAQEQAVDGRVVERRGWLMHDEHGPLVSTQGIKLVRQPRKDRIRHLAIAVAGHGDIQQDNDELSEPMGLVHRPRNRRR